MKPRAPRKTIKRNCKSCGKAFTVPKSKVGRLPIRGWYCSTRCYEWAKAPRPLICLVCKRTFMPKRLSNGTWSKKPYCSETCFTTAQEFNNFGIVPRICEQCGEEFTRPWLGNRYCSKACANSANYKPFHKAGAEHWNWQGGKTENENARYTSEYEKWRKAVFTRDNWDCQECGKHGGQLHAHHIFSFAKFPEYRTEIWNGVTLCLTCHAAVHPSMNLEREIILTMEVVDGNSVYMLRRGKLECQQRKVQVLTKLL